MEVSAEDLRLPHTAVARLIKEALPEGTNVSKEARTAIARAAAIFVLHATTFANEHAQRSASRHRAPARGPNQSASSGGPGTSSGTHDSAPQTMILAEDVLYAIGELDCEELRQPVLDAYEAFKRQREQRKHQHNQQKAKLTAIEDTFEDGGGDDDGGSEQIAANVGVADDDSGARIDADEEEQDGPAVRVPNDDDGQEGQEED